MADPNRQLASLGRAVTQINLRLSRISEQLEGLGEKKGAADGAGDDALFDLIDVVERTLNAPVPTPPEPGWLARMLGLTPALETTDLSGLRLGLDAAVDALARRGVYPAPSQGPIDPKLHQVLQAKPTTNAALDGHIESVHRSGWHRDGEPLRTAQVSAWRLQTTDSEG